MSVTIGDDGSQWYGHLGWVTRPPASNEKLLLSMALLQAVGPDRVIATRAMASAAPVDGVIDGDLWLVGHGDPELAPEALVALATQIANAGVTRIEGSVVGDTGPFERDWWAEGWKDDFPSIEVASRRRSRSAATSGPTVSTSTTPSCGRPSSSPRRSAGMTWWSRSRPVWARPTVPG